MAIFTKRLLSGSTNGRGILVAEDGTPGTTVHTAVSGTTDVDEIWIWATNSSGAPVLLTLEWGGTTDPDDLIEVSIPATDGLTLVAPGLPLQNGLAVAAFASVEDVVTLHGFVNRIEAA